MQTEVVQEHLQLLQDFLQDLSQSKDVQLDDQPDLSGEKGEDRRVHLIELCQSLARAAGARLVWSLCVWTWSFHHVHNAPGLTEALLGCLIAFCLWCF